MDGLLHEDITREIIGAAFEVHNVPGYGFLEKVYQRALQVELIQRGLDAKTEHPVKVHYKGAVGGDCFADLLVADCVVVELKVAPAYDKRDEAELLNELKASGMPVGLPVNFGREKVDFHRFVF